MLEDPSSGKSPPRDFDQDKKDEGEDRHRQRMKYMNKPTVIVGEQREQ